MGRKIPSKKHRGVKDPLEQQAKRLKSLQGKINAPPKDPDEQPVPQSLLRLFAFQDKSDRNSTKKSNKKKRSIAGARRSESNPITKLKQLPGETGRSFSLRINSAVRALDSPLDQQNYPEDTEAEDAKGSHMAAWRERRQRRHAAERPPRTSRAQKLKAKAQAKKDAAPARPEVQYERVSFGDVAHAPPALPRPRRAAPVSRPGQRTLLLSAMLEGGATAGAAAAVRGAAAVGGAAAADRERRERARLSVVAAYREHKKQARAARGARGAGGL